VDLNTYIESGILEQYVLGQLSPAAMREVEAMAAAHDSVRQEIESIEQALEYYAQAGSVTPPPGTLDNIKSRIHSLDPPISRTQNLPGKWTTLLAAASALLLISSIYLWIENQRISRDLIALTSSADVQKMCCDSSRLTVDSLAQIMVFLQDPNTRSVVMRGTEKNPDAQATLLFNAIRQIAFVNLNTLPSPPSGKQYQLWALVDGQPVDMGVLPLGIANDQQMVMVPYQATAGGYAVTLEPEGGSEVPTLEAMVMVGMI
jgi:anti-sigma-K factor RskA